MSRVWEVVVSSCTEAERKEIYKKSLKEENLALMVENPFANFVLQRFLDAIETVEVVCELVDKFFFYD